MVFSPQECVFSTLVFARERSLSYSPPCSERYNVKTVTCLPATVRGPDEHSLCAGTQTYITSLQLWCCSLPCSRCLRTAVPTHHSVTTRAGSSVQVYCYRLKITLPQKDLHSAQHSVQHPKPIYPTFRSTSFPDVFVRENRDQPERKISPGFQLVTGAKAFTPGSHIYSIKVWNETISLNVWSLGGWGGHNLWSSTHYYTYIYIYISAPEVLFISQRKLDFYFHTKMGFDYQRNELSPSVIQRNMNTLLVFN